VDAVIDACDQVRAKVVMAAWAMRQNRTSLHHCGCGGRQAPGPQGRHRRPVACTHDPLLASLRNRCARSMARRAEGRKIGVPCVFSREPVQPVDPSCAIDVRWHAQLPRLWIDGERDRHLRPVCRRLGV
jgi:tRNA A37 threonylcarbamoyladenosine dehydratase